MKRLYVPLVVLFSIFFGYECFAQPFAIGETNITFNDPVRGRNIPAQIYYPASTAGTDVAPAAGQHCVIVFGHGFLIGFSQYQWLANALVPNGYIVAFPDTETGFPDHGAFGGDIAFLVGAIQAEGTNTGSVLFGGVGANSAVGGHSMGGGASFLAAGGNTGIDALFNFAAAETNPSAIAAAGSVSVPTLVFEGTDDCVTPSAGNTGDMYAALNTPCQSLISITGGSHCQFANSDFVCGLGEFGCGGSIAQGDQENTVITYLLPFLNYHLKMDCDAGTTFDGLLTTPVGSTTQSNCTVPDPAFCSTTCANVDLNIQFDGFPAQTSWEILDANNMVVASSGPYTSVAGNSSTTETNCLADGCYTLNFYDGLNNGMCPFQSSAVGVSTFITPGTLIAPGSIVGTLSLVATPGLCGNYSLNNSAGTTLVSGGGSFGAQESQTFCLTGGMKASIAAEEEIIKLYPTKVKELVWIESTVDLKQIRVFDAQGKMHLQLSPNGVVKQFDVSALSAGLYWVELLSAEGLLVERLVKE